MTLEICTGLWGEANLMYGNPPLRIFEGASFLPFDDTFAWGVFDDRNEIIEDSFDVRGAARVPHIVNRTWPTDRIVEAIAPMIYMSIAVG